MSEAHSIFPRARRISALVASVCGVVAMLFGAVTWIAQLRSEYDALRLKVATVDLAHDAAVAQCAADDRRIRAELIRSEQANVQLREALEHLFDAQPARTHALPAFHDAKSALERAKTLQKTLQSEENWP